MEIKEFDTIYKLFLIMMSSCQIVKLLKML